MASYHGQYAGTTPVFSADLRSEAMRIQWPIKGSSLSRWLPYLIHPWWVRVYKPSLSTAVKNAHPWKLNSVMSVTRGTLTPYVPTYFLGRLPSPKRLRDESCWGLGPLFGNVWYTLNCTWLWCSFRRMSIITMKQPVYLIYIDYLLHVNIPNMRQLSIPSCRFSIILLCR